MPTTPGSGGPPDGPDDEAEFRWLYGSGADPATDDQGDATRLVPRIERPAASEQTHALPVQPGQPAGSVPTPARGSTGGSMADRRTTRPTPPPLAPPPGTPARRGGSLGWLRPRRPRFRLRYLFLLLALWVAYLVFVPLQTWHNVHQVAWEPRGDRPAEQPGTTYLLVGSDSRANLTKKERAEYHTGNPSENLSDTIMLLHTGDGPNVLLSIPRDSYVDIPGHGTTKINAAYSYGGPKLLTATVEKNTGVRVDKYVEIGLGGVAQVVDAVGGVTVCPEYAMDDKDAGLHITKGCQEVDGRVALAYSRSRHAQRLGDLDRVKHQREVVAAIGHKVLSPWSILNPVRWWRLNHAVPDFFVFGDGMSRIDAGKWAMAMSRTTGDGGRTCTMPVTDGSATQWDMTRAKPMLRAIITDNTSEITKGQCTPAGIVGAS